jgi:hypothetical protein
MKKLFVWFYQASNLPAGVPSPLTTTLTEKFDPKNPLPSFDYPWVRYNHYTMTFPPPHLALQLPEHLFFVVKREKEILFDFLPFKGPYKIVSKRFLDYLQTTGLPENYEVARLTVVSHTGKSLSEQGYFALRFARFDDALVHFEEGSKRDVPMLKNRFVYDTIHATETTDREVFVVDNFCYQETLLVTEKAKTAIQETFYRSAIYSAAAFSTAYRQDNEW